MMTTVLLTNATLISVLAAAIIATMNTCIFDVSAAIALMLTIIVDHVILSLFATMKTMCPCFCNVAMRLRVLCLMCSVGGCCCRYTCSLSLQYPLYDLQSAIQHATHTVISMLVKAEAFAVQCMQVLPQVYMHDGMPTSYEPGLLVQPHGIVHHGLPMLDVHTYFTECHDAHQIVERKVD